MGQAQRKLSDIAQAYANNLTRRGYPRLASAVWTRPESYGGYSPDGDIVLAVRTRDSSALERVNWDSFAFALKAEAYDGGRESHASRPNVYHWRAGHWACGWVEYLCARPDRTSREMLAKAESMLESLESYPVLNDDALSELEWTEAAEYWESCSIAERVRMIQDSRCGASIFAARRAEIPQDDDGSLFEMLRG